MNIYKKQKLTNFLDSALGLVPRKEDNIMGISQYDYEKLLDDIKLISKSVVIILDENNPDNRKRAGQLTEDLVNRLYRDIKEMRDTNARLQGFGGHLDKNGNEIED